MNKQLNLSPKEVDDLKSLLRTEITRCHEGLMDDLANSDDKAFYTYREKRAQGIMDKLKK